jgi:hypothetical protein
VAHVLFQVLHGFLPTKEEQVATGTDLLPLLRTILQGPPGQRVDTLDALAREVPLLLPPADGLTADAFSTVVAPLLPSIDTDKSFWLRVAAANILLPLNRRRRRKTAFLVAPDTDNCCCNADSLGVAFSFLAPKDYQCAITTCRSWYAMRLCSQSWPAMPAVTTLHQAVGVVLGSDERHQLPLLPHGVRFLRNHSSIDMDKTKGTDNLQATSGFTRRLVEIGTHSKNTNLQVRM